MRDPDEWIEEEGMVQAINRGWAWRVPLGKNMKVLVSPAEQADSEHWKRYSIPHGHESVHPSAAVNLIPESGK